MHKFYSSREIEHVLSKFGFVLVAQKGLHGKFKHNRGKVVILPMNKKEVPSGALKSILRQSDISLEQFEKKLTA